MANPTEQPRPQDNPEDGKEVSYDTSDPQEVNKAKKRSARTKADRLKFIEAAMSHAEGRAWFNDILTFCHIFSTSFMDDPYRTAFKCGEHNVGIRMLSDIQEAAADNYLVMIRENKKT